MCWMKVARTLHKTPLPSYTLVLNNLKRTWEEAFAMCSTIGGHLPEVRDRNELDELISLFQLSHDMPPVEAIYIGLYENSKVRICCFWLTHELFS